MSVCEAELLFFGNATDIWLLLATCDYGGGVVFVADVAWLVQLRLLPLLVVCRTCSWPFGGFGPCCTARRLAATVASMLCNFYNDTMLGCFNTDDLMAGQLRGVRTYAQRRVPLLRGKDVSAAADSASCSPGSGPLCRCTREARRHGELANA